jgi:hypothetical protein
MTLYTEIEIRQMLDTVIPERIFLDALYESIKALPQEVHNDIVLKYGAMLDATPMGYISAVRHNTRTMQQRTEELL